jgi:hypothetical protein
VKKSEAPSPAVFLDTIAARAIVDGFGETDLQSGQNGPADIRENPGVVSENEVNGVIRRQGSGICSSRT